MSKKQQHISDKIAFFSNAIQQTMMHIQRLRTLELATMEDCSICMNACKTWNQSLKECTDKMITTNPDEVVNRLQAINTSMSTIFKNYGTSRLEDLLCVCFGANYINSTNGADRFELLTKYFHPISYKITSKKILCENEDESDENNDDIICSDVSFNAKKFVIKSFGMEVAFYNHQQKKTLLVLGLVDNVVMDCLNSSFILKKRSAIMKNAAKTKSFDMTGFENFIDLLTLKDYFTVHSHDVSSKFVGHLSRLNELTKQQTTSHVVKEFVSSEMYVRRNMLIHLLTPKDNPESHILAQLLYDLLLPDGGGSSNEEQVQLYQSLPWSLSQKLTAAMNAAATYANELANNASNGSIPLEQQICLMKAPDTVKEKAMQKLKEVKSKSEDSGAKARQYLDGLLKIPFQVYRQEPILQIMQEMKDIYQAQVSSDIGSSSSSSSVTSLQIQQGIHSLKQSTPSMCNVLESMSAAELKAIAININGYIKEHNVLVKKLRISNLSSENRRQDILQFIQTCPQYATNNPMIVSKMPLTNAINQIDAGFTKIHTYMSSIVDTLNESVYGHKKAKKQIERIIGQWINGKADGYCFGFEGPPGVGKTSLAKKGLANCLQDDKGVPRPFAMIQLGGDSNGSTLHGHNYTYVGSTWGTIVQILMDKKCMNPIIYIDEVDKISRTENGREIVGILTHLLDASQNDSFQDKYFSGIELDLSKALFVLSYNDPDAIDHVLLDRIHRVRFEALSLDEKLVILKKHMLPEIYAKMGLQDMIHFDEATLTYIIGEYTYEAGVRKLKEILFEIVGEINLEILKHCNNTATIPIVVTINDLKEKYLKDKKPVHITKVHSENKVGIINGLWANAQGQGGILPIQVGWRPSTALLQLHLTGLQGDVMKESMNVASTLAWKLTSSGIKQRFKDTLDGIHIHCPEGATPKDGPSAGAAITTAIYSLLNQRKIKAHIAMTGEITLDGKVTAIGGLDLKILGGIKAGVCEFLYPKENRVEFEKFMEKYKDKDVIAGIKFHEVEHIEEVFALVLES